MQSVLVTAQKASLTSSSGFDVDRYALSLFLSVYLTLEKTFFLAALDQDYKVVENIVELLHQ